MVGFVNINVKKHGAYTFMFRVKYLGETGTIKNLSSEGLSTTYREGVSWLSPGIMATISCYHGMRRVNAV